VKQRREAWLDSRGDLDPEKLVFIDEAWTTTNMARKNGHAPKGERLRGGVPHGHWKTTTFVAGLRLTKMTASTEPGLCRSGPRSDALAGRHDRAGQPEKPLSGASPHATSNAASVPVDAVHRQRVHLGTMNVNAL
jgi:hypothetical protein